VRRKEEEGQKNKKRMKKKKKEQPGLECLREYKRRKGKRQPTTKNKSSLSSVRKESSGL